MGVRKYLMDILNLLANREIFKLEHANIKKVFKNYCRIVRKKNRGGKNVAPQSSNSIVTILTKNEIRS
jgi:hypothetical protein